MENEALISYLDKFYHLFSGVCVALFLIVIALVFICLFMFSNAYDKELKAKDKHLRDTIREEINKKQ